MSEQKIIMYDDANTASIQNLTGWVGLDGRYWGTNEHMARWSSCTHLKCSCGEIMVKHYTLCEKCRAVKMRERYAALEYKQWDGNTPLALYDDDKYFFSEDDLTDYCHENEIKTTDLMLVLCKPQYYSQIDYDHWQDDLPEEWDLPDGLMKKVNELNEYIKTLGVASWFPDKYRTIVDIAIDTE